MIDLELHGSDTEVGGSVMCVRLYGVLISLLINSKSNYGIPFIIEGLHGNHALMIINTTSNKVQVLIINVSK